MQLDSVMPRSAYVEARRGGAVVYRMDLPDGYGRMTEYAVLPGLTLVRNEFHTASGLGCEAPRADMVEINHCRRGRFTAQMPGGTVAELGAQDFAVSDRAHPPRSAAFSLGTYEGISIVAQLGPAQRSLDGLLGPGMVEVHGLFRRLFGQSTFLVLRREEKIQRIFSELYAPPAGQELAYFRLKTAELFLFLQLLAQEGRVPASCYQNRTVQARVEAAARALTQNPGQRVPLAAVCRGLGLSKTTLNRQFQARYGETPSAYARRRRMETAALWLTTTDRSVGGIAQALGYQNMSKFSKAFVDFYGKTPSAYKRER